MPVHSRYDDIAEFYDERFGDDRTDDPPTAGLLDLAGDVTGLRVLDLGCGQGRLTRVLTRRGATLTGLDLSSRLVQIALEREGTERLGIEYLVGDAGDPAVLAADVFDLVVSDMCITDFEDLPAVFQSVSRTLRPGGRLVFSMLHPCYPGSGWASAWSPDGYHVERWWTTGADGVRGRVGSHHRKLSTILNTLVEKNLTTERVAEPVWASSERGPENGNLPAYLVVSARRNAAETSGAKLVRVRESPAGECDGMSRSTRS